MSRLSVLLGMARKVCCQCTLSLDHVKKGPIFPITTCKYISLFLAGGLTRHFSGDTCHRYNNLCLFLRSIQMALGNKRINQHIDIFWLKYSLIWSISLRTTEVLLVLTADGDNLQVVLVANVLWSCRIYREYIADTNPFQSMLKYVLQN